MGGVPSISPVMPAYPPAYGGAYVPPQVGYGYGYGASPFYWKSQRFHSINIYIIYKLFYFNY